MSTSLHEMERKAYKRLLLNLVEWLEYHGHTRQVWRIKKVMGYYEEDV